MSGYGTPYGVFSPYSDTIPLETKWPESYLDYTESFAYPITNPETGVVDPIVSLSLSVAPSGVGELAVSRLTVDETELTVTWWEADGVSGRNYDLNLIGLTAAGRDYQWVFSQECDPEGAIWPLPVVPNPGFGPAITWTAPSTTRPSLNFSIASNFGLWMRFPGAVVAR